MSTELLSNIAMPCGNPFADEEEDWWKWKLLLKKDAENKKRVMNGVVLEKIEAKQSHLLSILKRQLTSRIYNGEIVHRKVDTHKIH